MLQLDSEIINGIGGGAGGLGIAGVLLYVLNKVGVISIAKKNGKENNEHVKTCAKQVDEIHGWYGPRGPMDRMTTQMEELGKETIKQTGVLELIHSELKKD